MSRHGKIAEDKALLGFVIPRDLKERLRELAEAENRTLSNFLVTRLTAMIEEIDRAAKPEPKSAKK